MSEKVEKTFKMQAHQFFTALWALWSCIATGMLVHINTLRGNGLSVAEDADQGLGFVAMAAIASLAVVYWTRPIPVKTEGLERKEGVAYR